MAVRGSGIGSIEPLVSRYCSDFAIWMDENRSGHRLCC